MAQHEYVAIVDPATGAISRFDSIPGVMYIAPHAIFDDNAKRFLFIGMPSNQFSQTLFAIDAITGKVVSKALLPKAPMLISLRYDESSHILYGITLVSGSGNYSLVSIDINSGAYSTIANIKSIRSLSQEMMIDNNHNIILNCVDTSGHFSLTRLDVNGNLLSKVAIPNITGMQYDNSTAKLYGLNYSGTQEQLLQVDPLTGATSVICTLPADLLGTLQYCQTFDERGHRYFFAGASKDGINRLFSIDVNTGTVLYDPQTPASNVIDKENVIQFRYSNSLNKLYALNWKGTPDTTATVLECSLDANTKIYPNLSGNLLIVNKTPTKCQVRMGMYTLLGQVILENKILSDGQNNIPLPPLAAGIYVYKFFSGNTILQTGKIMITRR